VKEIDRAAEKVQELLGRTKSEMRIEEINKELGTNTRDLMRPIKTLLAEGKIGKRGERRSTAYYAL
jgi:predicted transcriptional regulator